MTTAGHDAEARTIAPSRRRGAPSTDATSPFIDAEIGRGQSDALLGALGRMQLRLDLLAREQAETFDRILISLQHIDARLEALEGPYEEES